MLKTLSSAWRGIVGIVVVGVALAIYGYLHRGNQTHVSLENTTADSTESAVGNKAEKSIKAAKEGISYVIKKNVSLTPPLHVKNNYVASFHSSADLFQFVSSIAEAAYEGDADAEYYIARAMVTCGNLFFGKEDTLAVIAKWNLPEAQKESYRADYQRCARFRTEDPFAMLPRRTGGYTEKYWMDRAVAQAQPVALMARAVSDLDQQYYADDSAPESLKDGLKKQAEKRRAEAQEFIYESVSSKNPEALLFLGTTLTQNNKKGMTEESAAWILAACDLGADCTARSDIFPLIHCINAGNPNCSTGIDIKYSVQQSLSPATFAKAFALADDIKYKLQNGDITSLKPYMNFVNPQ